MLTVVTPAQLTGNVDDYAPTGLSTASILRLDSDAARTVTGISAAVTVLRKKLINIGAFDITLAHQSSSSVAANRFTIPGGADLVLEPGDAVDLFCDVATATWRAV